ncbi:MAG: MFS transporter [Nitrososphaeraceae archaeon]
MNSSTKFYNSAPVLSLLLARIFYSANWFNIASIFYLIAMDFKQDISTLGLVTSSFILGVGLFQVPAGILAAKYSANRIAVFGILLASSCVFLTGLSDSIVQIAVLRFIVGVGMACFFGPSVVLISEYLGKRSEGLGIGLINSAHAVGGILGIFAWVVLAQLTGWRISLVSAGALGLVTGLILIISLSERKSKLKLRDEGVIGQRALAPDRVSKPTRTRLGISLSGLSHTIFNRTLIILGLTLLSFQAGSSIVLTFIVFYLGGYLKLDLTLAGLIGSLNLVIALLFSPLFGRLYDRTRKTKKILLISGLAAATGVLGMAVPSIYIIIPAMILSAIFLSAGFVIVYAEAKRINSVQDLDPQYQTLAVSYVNGISLFGASWIPILFSFAVDRFGFSLAWLLGGFIVLVLVLPAFKLK